MLIKPDYIFQIQINKSVLPIKTSVMLSLCVLTIFLKSVLYIKLFYFLYKHNAVIKLANILQPEVLQKRNRKNAITLTGQLAGALVELLYAGFITLLLIFKINWEIREYFSVFKTSEFFILPIIEILTSPPLKKFVFNQTSFPTFLCSASLVNKRSVHSF